MQAEQQRQEARGIRPRPPQPADPAPPVDEQRQPAAAVPTAGEFPTLDQAMRHNSREQPVEPDYLAQALQELKLSECAACCLRCTEQRFPLLQKHAIAQLACCCGALEAVVIGKVGP